MSATEKISVTMGRDELRRARAVASNVGVSLSSFVTDAVRERLEDEERRVAAEKILATFLPEERASPEERAALLASWSESKSVTRAHQRRGRRAR